MPVDPTALKTVGQFLLMGDPSLHAVAGAKPKTRPTARMRARSAASTASTHAVTRGALTETAALLARGADSVKTGVRTTSNDAVRSKFASVAAKAGMVTSGPVSVFQVAAASDPSAREAVVRRAPKGRRTGARSARPGSVRFHVCFATTTYGRPDVVAKAGRKAGGKAVAKGRAGAKPATPPPAGVQRHAVLIAREQGGRVTIKKLFARLSPSRSTMPRHFEGHVIKKLFARGSKSQRPAVILKTADAELVLRREGGNAFQDPVLDGLVGHRIRGTGEKTGYTLILRDWEDLDGKN